MKNVIENNSISKLFLLASTASLVLFPFSDAQAQKNTMEALNFNQEISTGKTVSVHNINGSITVEGTSGRYVEVRANKRWLKTDPETVQLDHMLSSRGDLVVCALWNNSVCTENGVQPSKTKERRQKENDVSVSFTVMVPDGVNVVLKTVNGAINVRNISGAINANTVNGSVDASTNSGPVSAGTVNGSIDATMGDIGSTPLEFNTVNGSVTLRMPERINTDIDLSLISGSIETDFPVTIQGRMSKNKLRGTIGKGGERLKARTINGHIRILRSVY